ncbi:MAG: triple tyrosine motif-containing protein, partial [Bacteroidota bacterium]
VAGKFTRYESAPNDSTRLSHNSVNAILQDRRGTIWIGTGRGLNRFNGDGTFTVFTTRDGFANDYINALREDSRGILWISTNKGLTRFDPEQKIAVNYFSSDGLPSDEFTFGTPWKTADGEMFFGNIKGAVYFHPENITTNEFIPPVVFTEFQKFYSPAVLEKDISRIDRVVLDYSENIFSVSFAALNYLQSSKNQYAYKMAGFSDEWIPLGTRRTVTFTHLNPGEYTLLVKGSNNDGVWNETPASLAITIVPPFWRTWWFISVSSILLIGIIVAQVRLRIRRLTKEKEMQREFTHRLIDRQESERKRIANELHDSLGQNLLVIKNKLLLKQQEKTIETEELNEVSDIVSGTIQEVRNISHHLRPHQLDQLGLTKTLRALVKSVTDSSQLQITSQIDDIDGIFTPDEEISLFRIIQESFNNILKHSGATKTAVNVVRNGDSIIVTVTDNGKGISASEGFGISGMRERANMFGWSFAIESNQGTQLTLIISLKKV